MTHSFTEWSHASESCLVSLKRAQDIKADKNVQCYLVYTESVLRSDASAARRCSELHEEFVAVTQVELRSCCLPLEHSRSPRCFPSFWSHLWLDDKTQQTTNHILEITIFTYNVKVLVWVWCANTEEIRTAGDVKDAMKKLTNPSIRRSQQRRFTYSETGKKRFSIWLNVFSFDYLE